MNADKVLVLKTCKPDMTSYGGLRWPCRDEAPDNQGFYGLLWGEGDWRYLDWSDTAVWLVVEVAVRDMVSVASRDKVRFWRGTVVYAGDRKGATDIILAHAPVGTACHGATVTVGDDQTAVVGHRGTAHAGVRGLARAGADGLAIAGAHGLAEAGRDGRAVAGFGGMAVAADGGTAAVGHYGEAQAGADGRASAETLGIAHAGHGGVVSAGIGGILMLRWYHDGRQRIAVAYVGEDGIEPDVAYRLDENGRFVRAEEETGR